MHKLHTVFAFCCEAIEILLEDGEEIPAEGVLLTSKVNVVLEYLWRLCLRRNVICNLVDQNMRTIGVISIWPSVLVHQHKLRLLLRLILGLKSS